MSAAEEEFSSTQALEDICEHLRIPYTTYVPDVLAAIGRACIRVSMETTTEVGNVRDEVLTNVEIPLTATSRQIATALRQARKVHRLKTEARLFSGDMSGLTEASHDATTAIT